MYRIRMHGRGGQGVKTGGRVLGSALFASGFEVQDAPFYGAERRGAPIAAYVRAAHAPIHERGAITRPDLVVVGDATLLAIGAAKVLEGLSPATVLLVRGAGTREPWRDRLGHRGPIVTLPGAAAEDDGGGATVIGMQGAGAAARLLGVVPRATLEEAVRAELRGTDLATLERASAAALAAFDALAEHAGIVREGPSIPARGYAPPEWVEPVLEDVALGAPDVHAPRTTERVRTGLWRSERPEIDYARCNRCSWVCGTLCPDGAIASDAEHAPHIDYEHCKGCMICVAVCPAHAIRVVPEPGVDGAAP